MNSTMTAASDITAIDHDEAMRLSGNDWERMFDLLDGIADQDWSRATDCPGWDVAAVVGHLLGMLELQASPDERTRQVTTAAAIAKQTGAMRLDEMTALQVREHAHLSPDQLRTALHAAVPPGLTARAALPAEVRGAAYDTELPGETPWKIGYLFDIIHTRDPWLHRVDISRAVGRDMVLTSANDGRIVADVVADWTRRHGQPYTLVLDGPAGGTFTNGSSGPDLHLDAIEFCRILSGRAAGSDLLATSVPF